MRETCTEPTAVLGSEPTAVLGSEAVPTGADAQRGAQRGRKTSQPCYTEQEAAKAPPNPQTRGFEKQAHVNNSFSAKH